MVKVLLEGIVLVMVVLFLFLGDLRSSLVVIATLVLTPPLTFMVMNQIGLSAIFLPLMTLEGMEGKMFAPLAYTIAIALGLSLVWSLTLSAVLSSYLVKGGSEEDTLLVRMLKRPYVFILNGALRHRLVTVAVAVILFGGATALFRYWELRSFPR